MSDLFFNACLEIHELGSCAGKSTVADYLVKQHDFRRIFLIQQAAEVGGTVAVDIEASEPAVGENLQFDNATQLRDFVTKNWRSRWVTTSIWDERVLDQLIPRPFFLLIAIEAPLQQRWARHEARRAGQQLAPLSLESFVQRDDQQLYPAALIPPGGAASSAAAVAAAGPLARRSGLASLMNRAQLRLLNTPPSLPALQAALDRLDLPDQARLRPDWDRYFMQLAALAAQRSNCMKRRVGCVLVREKRVISTGYNGTPRGRRCNTGQAAGVDLSTCLCIHAEENALLEAGRERIREGATLYCDTCPCLTCSIKIAQVGISEVVYSLNYGMDIQTAAILKEAGVHLRQFNPVREGLIDLNAIADTLTPAEIPSNLP